MPVTICCASEEASKDSALLLDLASAGVGARTIEQIAAHAKAKGWTLARTIEQMWMFYHEGGGMYA